MKTKITLTVEIEHKKNVSFDTIEECLVTGLKETFWTDKLHVTDVSFPPLKERLDTFIQENDGLSHADLEIITDMRDSIS